RLKDRLDKHSDASDSDSSIHAQPHTNRFNKLKRKARYVARGKLDTGAGIHAESSATHAYGSKRRRVVAKSHTTPFTDPATSTGGGGGVVSAESDDEADAYHDIHLDQILAQVDEPADVVHHPQARAVFQRKALGVLSAQALRTLSTEHAHRVELARLLTAFLGDDAVLCPTYDRNLGLPPDSAEEARRLLQAALDRSEEYLRCMQKVRAGLLKADRYRGKIYGWCKDSD
ncbi:RXT2-like protein, partial [Protomyces lactucae-debilis]